MSQFTYAPQLAFFPPALAEAITNYLHAGVGGAVKFGPGAGRIKQVDRVVSYTAAEMTAGATITKSLQDINGGQRAVMIRRVLTCQNTDATPALVANRLVTAGMTVQGGTPEIEAQAASNVFGSSADTPYLLGSREQPGAPLFLEGQETRKLTLTNNTAAALTAEACFTLLVLSTAGG